MTRDYGHEAQAAAELHLEECFEALYSEDHATPAPWPETAGAFCGCETCVVREVLYVAYPIFEAAFKTGDLP